MNYLHDRKAKKKKYIQYAVFAAGALLLFYLSSYIFSGLATVTHVVFRPILSLGNGVGGKLGSFGAYFKSKGALRDENERLKSELDSMEARVANYHPLRLENEELKEILGRKPGEAKMVLSAILSKPSQSLYDTLIIDAGTSDGLKEGDTVFAWGNIPIGTVAEAYGNSSKVLLFSSSGVTSSVMISGLDASVELVGRGGGNFEILLPRDLVVEPGTEITLPGITPYVVGVMQAVISNPRDAFQKVLIVSPVNIQQLKFVEVEI